HMLGQRHHSQYGSACNVRLDLNQYHVLVMLTHSYLKTVVLITSPLVNDFVIPCSSSIIKPPSLAICFAVPVIILLPNFRVTCLPITFERRRYSSNRAGISPWS